jgi:hypothetical protein
MSFDPRSRERLEALGRQLPKKLPVPPSGAAATGIERAGSERRHRVETEQDPERLFRELMNVSPDGMVPPHLLERLKQLEGSRRPAPAAAPEPGGNRPARRGAAANRGEPDLYTVFQQLLLEEGDADSTEAPVREY